MEDGITTFSSEQALHTAVEFVKEGIAIVDKNGIIIYVNNRLPGLFGYRDNESLIGSELTSLISRVERSSVIRNLKKTVNNKTEKIYNYTFIRTDGSTFMGECKVRPINGTNCKPSGYVTVISDNSKGIKAREDNFVIEQNFHKDFDKSPVGIEILSLENDLLYANKSLLDIYGFKNIHELETTPPSVRLTPKSYVDYSERYKKSKSGKFIPCAYEVSIIRIDGKIRHLIAFCQPIIWKGQVCNQISYNDITEVKESEELYRALANNSPVGVYIVQNGRLCYVNPNIIRTTGYSREELIGKNPKDFVYPDDMEYVRDSAVRILKDDAIDSYEFRYINRRGEIRWAIESVSSISYHGKRATIGNFIDITDHRRMVRELSYSDTALRSIHEGVYAMDNAFIVTRWNSICEELFGVNEEDAIGKFIWEVLPFSEDYQGQNQDRINILAKQGFTKEERVFNSPEGELWVDINTQAVETNDERFGWIAIVSDISERKRMENELRDSEQYMRSLINSLEDLVFTYDLDGHFGSFYKASQLVQSHLDDSDTEFIGAHYRNVLPASVSDKLDSAFKLVIDTGENTEFDFSVVFDQKDRWYNAKVSPIRDTSGEFSEILVVSRDITDRKHMEEMINKAANEWETTFNTMFELIYIIDKYYRIVKANKTFCEHVDKEFSEITGRYCFEILEGRNDPCPQCVVPEVLRTGKPVLNDFVSSNQVESWQAVTTPLFGDNQQISGFIITARDVTEKMKMTEQIKQTQVLASLGSMTTAIAHEVNNPLGSILLLSELLLKDDKISHIKKDLMIIHNEAKRAAKIMSILLTYKNNHVTNNRRLNLTRIIRKVLDIRQYGRKVSNINLYTNLPETTVYVKGNSSQLAQVFMNILINAEEAVKAKKAGRINVDVTNDQEWIKVSVSDNGTGIPDENFEKIFLPFFTTKKGGTGFGLSTCYQIVTAHNGLIHAENNEMGGVTVTIELPVIHKTSKH